jgi:phosphate:Na+ symporter
MRMLDMVESMLKGLVEVFGKDDRVRAAAISRMDPTLDRLGVAIREYLTELGGEALNEEDGERSQDILAFIINIEHIGDITANNLMEFAAKKAARGQDFSADDILDLAAMHGQVMESLQLAVAVFLRSDVRARRSSWWRANRCFGGWRTRVRSGISVHCANTAMAAAAMSTCASCVT